MSNTVNIKKISQTLNLVALLTFFLIYTTDAFAQRRYPRHPIPQGPQTIILKARLFNKVVYGPTTIGIKRLVREQNYGVRLQGKKLKAVVVKASKLNYYGRGAVQVLIDGVPQGRRIKLSEYTEKIVIPIYGRSLIGRDIRTVRLKVFGDVQLKMVGLRLKTNVYTRGRTVPRNPRTGRGRIPRY